ncbi:transcription-repair coupling factor [Wenyingzhuangia aestuarii]|uniref:transcription-repair coupling factor n=1 Tax=Wenyingzhuangia aestuarii TaxID=1647582 RepID=UPI0014398FB1|nr:transcription-repair coupling factor [Wenyingzhuangia aestuarii]NJB81311.1 transcription-repair coupling factor (superfamily II helicase) [Wenyingzhuangia aestuarii]
MKIQSILETYQNANVTQQLIAQVSQEKSHHILSKFNGAALSFTIAQAFKQTDKTFLIIFDDKEKAAYHLNDLERLINDKDVLFYPGSYRRPYEIEDVDNANVLMRAEVLNRLNSRKKPAIIVTYPNALFEKVVTKKDLNSNTLKITQGDEYSIDFINEVLFEYKFNRVDFVTEPGEFAVRGGIVDVFSFANDEPYRLEFFGDEIDSIRTFDVASQLSTGNPNKIHIMPNVENKQFSEKRESFLKFIPNNSVVFTQNMDILLNDLNVLFEKASTRFQNLSEAVNHTLPSELFLDGIQIKEQLKGYNRISIQNNTNTDAIDGNTEPQPSFNKHFDLLIENLQQNSKKGYRNYLFCSNDQQAKRFHDIFDESEEDIEYETVVFQIHEGFVDHHHKIVCYTDHQIFERYNKFQLKNGFAKKQAVTLQEINNLEIGDFVTHIDHGIGKFGGLQKIDVNGKKQEAIKLIYGDADVLYISIHSLHKISKFTGKDGKEPKVHKLGSPAWKKAKQKAKTRVKQIAFDLIQLYAKRKNQIGFRYDPDSYLQHELEASFMYEDTPDQFTATQDVKSDMESDKPMDRLVCGDVGFGKTEVAIRAAFKAVDNGKQVAVLVPTTILAFQHFKSFKKRLEDLPVNINYLNRFKTAKQKKIVLDDLASGRLDIVIGTHQLVSDKIKYKDLGLLIIDEEQKFGVAAKDKLKTIKENVDTLTLTATPIPRTLQFSLMAARDLSVIATPPPNRHPIETNVIGFSEETIRDAVMYEISRGGQIFFIHNRVDNIKEVAGMLQRLVPNARIGIGHGQLEGRKLEEVMVNFMEGSFDILVATTIIESGLDVPNANTIFINHANNFGLSDLHQMRGRVGRSNKKAFCYFICPPYHMMTDDARKRIQALEMFSELGSGINIAMKDLEIRGAGDLLGGEQSGFITDIGFDTYQKILEEAVKELKENEFKELYNEEDKEHKEFVSDIQIDTDFEILFPDDYVNSISERLNLYKQLGELTEEIQLQEFEKHLTDRFGELPTQVVDLLDSVRIKWLAKKLGLEKIILKQKRMIGYFIANQQSEYYTTQAFTNVLKYVQNNSKMCVMKEKQTKAGLRLLITFIRIDSVKKALEVLRNI